MSLTVAIVVQRNPSTAFKRTWQRAAGTLTGVLFTGLFLLVSVPVWGMIITISLLAAARVLLLEKNYAAYAAVMTPLIILLLDFGRTPSPAVITDRLAATLAGCVVSLLFGYLGWSRLTTPITGGSNTSKGR
jgi:uncharacterized membrane protein YccC